MSLKPFAGVLLLSLACISLRAQLPGSFDPTFGTEGKTIFPIGTANAFGRAMAIQDDGKTVVACIANNGTDSDFALLRLTEAGQPDVQLSDDGMVLTDFGGRTDIAEAIAVDEFNRIIIAGSVDSGDGFGFAVARFLPDGTLDDSFSDDGLVTNKVGITDFCKSVAVQADHKIVLGGYVLNGFTGKNEFALMRFNSDGTPDSTFHDDGIVLINMGTGSGVANALVIQPDGKIVLAGQVLNETTFRWEIGMIRYNEDGTPDDTWDEDGMALTGSPDADYTIKAVAIQSDLKILVGGYYGTAPSDNLFAVARYHPDGKLDDSFGEEGILTESYGAFDNQVNEIVLQPDGQILIGGTTTMSNRVLFAVARLHPNGTFDESFGTSGVITPIIEQNDGINGMALQENGKLVVAGESFNGQRFSVAVARIETGLMTRVEEHSQNVIETNIYPNPVIHDFTLDYQLMRTSSIQIVLMDICGRVVYHFADRPTQLSGEYQENFVLPHDIESGIYFLNLSTGKNVTFHKLVIP